MCKSLVCSLVPLLAALGGCGDQVDATVHAGESIQAAIQNIPAMAEHYVIAVEPGVYSESLTVDHAGVELRGLVRGPGDTDRPILDGTGRMKDGVIASGANFTMRGFFVRNFTGNGVTAMMTQNVRMIDLRVDRSGLYGLYPVSSDGILIQDCVVSGANDSGIYVGQSKNAQVLHNQAFGNVTGIEIENTVGALVQDNDVHDNTGGILVFVLPNDPSKVGDKCTVQNNHSYNNNRQNLAEPSQIVSKVPVGIGILVMAADNTVLTDNQIDDNNSVGVGIISLNLLFPNNPALDVKPNPDGTQLRNNHYTKNGQNPDQALRDNGFMMGGDVLWDGTGTGVCQDEQQGANVAFIGITPKPC